MKKDKDSNKNNVVENDDEIIIETDNATDELGENVDENWNQKTTGKNDHKSDNKAQHEIKKLNKIIVDNEVLLAEMKDRLTRMAAEFDNYKKRTCKELDGRYTDAKADLIKTFLPIVDNFERAIKVSVDTVDINSFKQGVDLIFKLLMDVIAAQGVEEIQAIGTTFNPELHNAVMHIEDENYGDQEVVEVFSKGYKINDKVLRYSMVKVAN